jgi:nicotinamide mononucleotide transporter
LTAQQVVDALATISWTEWVAVACALAYLVLAVRQSAWCWLYAAVSSALYLWIFARTHLPMQAALQLFYIAMAGYGWYAWSRGRAAAGPLTVTRLRPRWHLAAVGAVLAVTALNVRLIGGATAAGTTPAGWVAFLDAGLAWASVFATWLVARKVLENWIYWIVTDLAAAWLYGTRELYATAALFVLYTLIAMRGYQSWRATMRQGARALPVHDAR